MKKILFLILALPALSLCGQPVKNPNGGFVINGDIIGVADGSVVDLLNGSTGASEATATVKGGKFRLEGKLDAPDYKTLLFNKSMPVVNFFLDNSVTTLMGSLEDLPNATLTGSKSNDEFKKYNAIVREYDNAVNNKLEIDKSVVMKTAGDLQNFVLQNPASYVSPLAIYKINLINNDPEQMERLFVTLQPNVQQGPIGSYVGQQVAELKRSPMGKPLPDFAQADPGGTMISLSSFRGKYVLVDFWASWCGPCRGENPNVVAAYNKYKDKNFTVLGVSLDRDKQKWLDAIAADGLPWTHVSDLKGWQNEVAMKFGISSIPQNFLIDPDGKVIAKNLRGEALESKLASVIR